MQRPHIEAFVHRLKELVDREDRAALARLRRGLGQEFGTAPDRDAWILARLPADVSDRHLADAATIASLFALHSAPGGTGTLAATLRILGMRTPADDGGPSSAVERRFVALLNSEHEDLPDRLRQAISLLKAHDLGIDWSRLFQDLIHWESDRRFVQRRWSRDFWSAGKDEAADRPETTTNRPA